MESVDYIPTITSSQTDIPIITTANVVTSIIINPDNDDIYNNDDENIMTMCFKKPKKKKMSIIFGCLTLLILVIVLVIVLIVRSNSKNNKHKHDNNMNTIDKTLVKEIIGIDYERLQLFHRKKDLYYGYILALLLGGSNDDELKEYSLSSSSMIELTTNPTSPQHIALEWLVYQDEYILNFYLNYDYSLLLEEEISDNNDNNKQRVSLLTFNEQLIQRFAIVSFYFATGGEDFWIHTNWLQPTKSECTFSGIVCSSTSTNIDTDSISGATTTTTTTTNHQDDNNNNTDNKNNNVVDNVDTVDTPITSTITSSDSTIIELNFIHFALVGTIPPDISLLKNLQIINFYSNRLSGSVPKELFYLSKLRVLQLTSNELQYLPSMVRTARTPDNDTSSSSSNNNNNKEFMENLEILLLNDNQFSGTIPNLPQSLKVFNVAKNTFTGPMYSIFDSWTRTNNSNVYSNTSTKITNLQRIVLSHNDLTGTIPTELVTMNPYLIELDLEYTKIHGTIPSELGLLPFEKFSVPTTDLTGTIPKELFSNSTSSKTLKYFNVVNTGISGTIPYPSFTNELQQLRLLDFSLTNINGTIPTEIGYLTNLTGLLFHTSDVSGTIPSEMGYLTNLRQLWAHDTNLYGTVPKEICTNIPNLVDLRTDCSELFGGKITHCDCCTLCYPS